MDPRLVQVLEKALAAGEIGSLFIGQGRKMRQVFLAGTEVYLVDAEREIRFCPVPFVLDGSVVPQTELDVVFGRFGSSPKSLAKLIEEDYELTDEQRDGSVDDFIALVMAVDGILKMQAKSDAEFFTGRCGRTMTSDEADRVAMQFLKAYRWQYIFSGASHPRFQTILKSMITDTQFKRIETALGALA